MERRNFIRSLSGSLLGLPLALDGMNLGILPSELSLFPQVMESDKVLVLIRLTGGNDGLNMLPPLDQYAHLSQHRSNILIPEKKVLKLTDQTGLHPTMTDMSKVFQEGKLGIVQSVGYPNQNRSHFRSLDIWTSGSSAEEKVLSGWLGRYLDKRHTGFPDNYPNNDYLDPIAITIGNNVSQTCQGAVANFSMAVNNPTNLSPISANQREEIPDTYYSRNLSFLHTAIEQTNAYSTRIAAASGKGGNRVAYWTNNRLAQKLKIVARLISGGLKTKIYVVTQGGYDTHSGQVIQGNPLLGTHTNLLRDLSHAVFAFQDDLKNLGLEDRVLGMTFSEFGRRIKSNGGNGSDHGTAGPLMLFGNCVNPTILGQNPEIPETVDNLEGVAMQYDYRSVYGSVLEDWFEVEPQEIRDLLYKDYQHLPLITCGKFVETSSLGDAFNYPNPFTDSTIIAFESKKEKVQLSILDGAGKVVIRILDEEMQAGKHRIPFTPDNVPAGNYYFYINKASGPVTKGMVKM